MTIFIYKEFYQNPQIEKNLVRDFSKILEIERQRGTFTAFIVSELCRDTKWQVGWD